MSDVARSGRAIGGLCAPLHLSRCPHNKKVHSKTLRMTHTMEADAVVLGIHNPIRYTSGPVKVDVRLMNLLWLFIHPPIFSQHHIVRCVFCAYKKYYCRGSWFCGWSCLSPTIQKNSLHFESHPPLSADHHTEMDKKIMVL